MNESFGGIFANRAIPPWLPRDAQDARLFAYWSQIIFFLMGLIWFVIGIAWIVLGIADGRGGMNPVSGFVAMIIAIVCGLAGIFLKKSVIDDIDHGRFHDAKTGCIIWGIIGVVAFILPTILLLIAYAKLSEAIAPHTPQYAPYTAGPAVGQPPQYQPPAQQPSQPQQAPQQQPQPAAPQPAQQPPQYPQSKDHRYEMMKCKNCGVQFPIFMANCPNCGAPKE